MALGFDKSDRDFQGGWAAKGSDVYARTAQHMSQNMHSGKSTLVLKRRPRKSGNSDSAGTVHDRMQGSARTNSPDLDEVGEFKGLALDSSFQGRNTAFSVHKTDLPVEPSLNDDQMKQAEGRRDGLQEKTSRQPRARVRAATLGDDPREQRCFLRAGLSLGFYCFAQGL